MIDWIGAVLNGRKQARWAFEKLGERTAGNYGQPLFVERCAWGRVFPHTSASTSAVIVFRSAIGLVHYMNYGGESPALMHQCGPDPIPPNEVSLVELDGAAIECQPDDYGRIETAILDQRGCGERLLAHSAVIESVIKLTHPVADWTSQVDEWPAPLSGNLLGQSPLNSDPSKKIPVTVAIRPSGVEWRTRDGLSMWRAWEQIDRVVIEGAEEFRTRVTLTRVAILGIWAIIFPKKETPSTVLSVQEIDGSEYAVSIQLLPSMLRTLIGYAVPRERQQTTTQDANVASELTVAVQLLKSGHISPEEFDLMKAKIIGN